MWEAHFAFHICTTCSLPELLRRSVVERAMRRSQLYSRRQTLADSYAKSMLV